MSKYNYGGQAVIEGIMMRGKHAWAIVIRKPDSSVTVFQGPVETITDRFRLLGKPVIRGFVTLLETLLMGMRSLTYSANQYAWEEAEELTTRDLVITFALALVITIGLFIMLPAFLIRQIQALISSNLLLNLIEGGVKISFFLLYILSIARMKDIQRVFQYHGAEHKVINCYEAGDELSIENAQKHSTIHTRCGTNFILIVLCMSVLIFSFCGRPPMGQRILIHLAITPLVAGLSYEIIRQAGKDNSHWIFNLLTLPGKVLQHLTTQKPDDLQVGVAIRALQVVVDQDALHQQEHKVYQFPISALQEKPCID